MELALGTITQGERDSHLSAENRGKGNSGLEISLPAFASPTILEMENAPWFLVRNSGKSCSILKNYMSFEI